MRKFYLQQMNALSSRLKVSSVPIKLFAFTIIAMFGQSCTLEETPNPSVVTFQTSSISHLEDAGEREIKLTIEPASSIDNVITLDVTLGSEVVYGEDFVSNPPLENSVIEIPIQRGDTEVSFTMTTIDNEIIDGNKTVTLRIANMAEGLIAGERNTLFFNIIDTDVVPDPEIFLDIDLLDFGEVMQLEDSEVLSYELTKISIESDIEINAPNGFKIGKTATGEFEESLTFPDEEFDEGRTTVYVKFSPSVLEFGLVVGLIEHLTEEAPSLASLSVTGIAIENPDANTIQWVEDFDYTGEWLPALPNSGSTSTNQEVSIDQWIAVRPERDGIALTDEILEFEGYSGSGIGRSVRLFHDGTNATDDNISRNLENYVISDENDNIISEFTTTYVSFMVKLEENIMDARSSPVNLGNWNTNGNGFSQFNTRIIIEVKEGGAASLGVQYPNPPSTIFEEDAIEVGKTYLIVFKNERKDGPGNDESSIFLFEQGDSVPMDEPEPLITVVTSGVERDMEKVILEEAQARNKMLIGGLRVANTWRDLF
ncbi:hypothetical protein [Mongoliibacter sp.]|uniref:hypothetical protein n=1 Tax=Mongoliibacter sp. TaxID=2022438 RepID=UPI0025FF0CED|nr:hypothetical protein [Mongoliibacter sp.]